MRLYACSATLLLAALIGCSLPLAKRTADFSKQAAPAIVAERGVYELVEATHARRMLVERVASYDTTSILAPVQEARFGSEADLAARTQVLDLLERYIEGLAAVSGGEAEKGIGKAGKEAAENAGEAAKQALPAMRKTKQPVITDTEIAGAAVAIAAIGNIFVDRDRKQELPKILSEAEGPVTTLCRLLREDLGDPAGGGLRYVLRIDFEAIQTAEDAAIRDHPEKYSYAEKRAAVEALFRIPEEQRRADATLVKAAKALEDLAKTHAALSQSAREKNAPTFRVLLAELVAEGQQLAAIESGETGSAK